MKRTTDSEVTEKWPAFDPEALLTSAGGAKTIVQYGTGDVIFTQGDASKHVMYIQTGGVKLSVLSSTGREAVVALLGPGHFFGEGCLSSQAVRMGSATAVIPTTIVRVGRGTMVRLLHKQRAMSDRFISDMLARNIRIEEDLIDQLFNASERRLARCRSSRVPAPRTQLTVSCRTSHRPHSRR